jgi:hypothetical protein
MTRGTKAQWAERVRRWRASGLPAQQFAMRERVNAATLRWWGSALKRPEQVPAGFIEVAEPRAESLIDAGRIEIVVRDGVVIRVSANFDPALLRRVVAALEAR